jgi:Ca2+-binding RTX toxin-like protein
VPFLQVLPATNWHGAISVEIASYSTEPIDVTPDADNTQLDVATFTINVAAEADAPIVAAPVSVAGVEDTAITITGLSASLVDTVATNGAEVLSVKISGVPQGSRFSAGSNNGDGSWTIPVAALPGIQITPPLNYSGTMTLTLTSIALELANGDEAQSAVSFDVVVAPRADSVEILAENVAVDASGRTQVDLNVRMADGTGSSPGENPAESIRITFTSVPAGVTMEAAGGGAFTNPSAGTWIFTGSEAQANAIEAAVGPTATGGTYSINLSAETLDVVDTLATAVTDSFQLTIPQVMTGNGLANALTGAAGVQILFGLGNNDTLSGGADADRLVGGTGADSLTGGPGADIFAYGAGDLGTGVDTITDFTNGVGGDALDIAALLSGFNAGSSILSDFVQVNQATGNSTIRIDADGGGNSFQDLVILQGVTGLNLVAMQTNGNLIV